jgi:hypothetical protein
MYTPLLARITPWQPAIRTVPSVTVSATSDSVNMPLTPTELTILSLERHTWQHTGAKEQAIRERLDMSAWAYYQLLNALIDTEAALATDPLTVGRLRRVRAQRLRSRSARVLA